MLLVRDASAVKEIRKKVVRHRDRAEMVDHLPHRLDEVRWRVL
jgi:hypothetical protein